GEDMNDVFGFGRKLGLLGHERRNITPFRPRRGGDRFRAAEKRGQTQRAHPHAAAAQKLAPRQKGVVQWRLMVLHGSCGLMVLRISPLRADAAPPRKIQFLSRIQPHSNITSTSGNRFVRTTGASEWL